MFLVHAPVSSAFKRNVVHGKLHQMDTAPVLGTEVFERQRIGNLIGIESISLISDDHEHSLAAFAAAADVNQPASVQAIAVDHRVTQGFPKREFNELLISEDTVGSSDQAHQPV